MTSHRMRASAILFSLAMVAACGGGGGSDGGNGGNNPGPGPGPTPPPSGRSFYGYLLDEANNQEQVSIFSADSAIGELRRVNSVPAAGAAQLVGAAVVGNRLYVADFGAYANPTTGAPRNPGGLRAYSINMADGALTPITLSTYAGFNHPAGVTVHPQGQFVYTPNFEGQSVSAFRIDSNGALSGGTNYSTNYGGSLNGQNPAQIAFTPDGRFAYTANKESLSITAFSVNTTTGALTAIQNVPGGIDPISLAVDPSGRSLYVANNALPDDPATPAVENNPGTVTMFPINSNGTLGASTSYVADILPQSVVVDGSGGAVYVANSGANNVQIFTRNTTTGALTLARTVAAGTTPWTLGLCGNSSFLYAANAPKDSGGVTGFALANNDISRTLPFTPGSGARAIACTAVQ